MKLLVVVHCQTIGTVVGRRTRDQGWLCDEDVAPTKIYIVDGETSERYTEIFTVSTY